MKYTLSNDTKAGQVLSELFERTEVVPKLAYYMLEYNKFKKNHPKDKAIELALSKTLLAFPTYHNISPLFAAVERFDPFIKYYLNVPKMLAFALDNSPASTFLFGFMFHWGLIAPQVSWALSSDDERKRLKWFKDNGFYYLGNYFGKTAMKYGGSLNPYDLNFLFDDPFSFQSVFFFNNVFQNITSKPINFISPITIK